MTRAAAGSTSRAFWSWRLLLVLCLLFVPLLAFPQRAFAAVGGSDDFNRADGSLGANWADVSDGGLAISSQVVAGTAAAGGPGGMGVAEGVTSGQPPQ